MALVPDQKFSTFQNGGDVAVGDTIVGLRGGINTRFLYTGELPPGYVVPIDQGGTGATTAAAARVNLGLGTMAVQDASAVAITGGTLSGVAITGSTAALTSGTVAAVPSGGTDIANKNYVDSLIAGSVESVTGTANQITVDNTDPQNPILSLPNDLIVPDDLTATNDLNFGMSNGQLLIGSTGNPSARATLTAGTGISIANSPGGIEISTSGGGFAVVGVAGTSQAVAVNTTYIALNAGQTTFTMPSTFSFGDVVQIMGSTANTGGWVINAAAGDTIRINNSTTTSGGSVTSAAVAGQTIELVCDVANTSWVMMDTASVTLTTA